MYEKPLRSMIPFSFRMVLQPIRSLLAESRNYR